MIRKTGQAAKIIESEIADDVPAEQRSAAGRPQEADPADAEETPAKIGDGPATFSASLTLD